MARSSLDNHEIALIKAMLNRGMRNNAIQFYFNRPSRPVNSGRITEIKNGHRSPHISPATDEELEAFLNIVDKERAAPEPIFPPQEVSALTFSIGDKDQIEVIPDPPVTAPDSAVEQLAVYRELREKTESALSAGDNVLGAVRMPLERFSEALTVDMSKASMTVIWLRGSSLRSILRAHEAVMQLEDVHPERLDLGIAERLRDVVEAFNIFVFGDARGRFLDVRRLGPDERSTCEEAVQLANSLAEHSSEIASKHASSLLREQTEAAASAPRTDEGDQVVGLARASSSNFVISVIRHGFDVSKRILGAEFRAAWQYGRRALYAHLAIRAAQEHELIIKFIIKHLAKLETYAEAVIASPTATRILNFIANVFG